MYNVTMKWSSKEQHVCHSLMGDGIGAGAANSFTPPIQCHNDNNNRTQNQNKHQSDLYAKIQYWIYVRQNGLAFVFEWN